MTHFSFHNMNWTNKVFVFNISIFIYNIIYLLLQIRCIVIISLSWATYRVWVSLWFPPLLYAVLLIHPWLKDLLFLTSPVQPDTFFPNPLKVGFEFALSLHKKHVTRNPPLPNLRICAFIRQKVARLQKWERRHKTRVPSSSWSAL